jgi:hypothetical protein
MPPWTADGGAKAPEQIRMQTALTVSPSNGNTPVSAT